MRILIKSLTLVNFKGVRSLKVEFGERNTNISGQNATGKTTIFDAFTWLMFGKNSGDEKEFNIKALDKNNNAIHKLKHEVSGLIECDGIEYHLRKELREKWVKKRGSEESEFTGHETTYFVNDVPLSQGDYKKKIDEIINENLFKLISNPNQFNQMKWAERREVLTKMAGVISDIDIAGNDKELQGLIDLLKNKSLKELKAQISAEKKRIKEELYPVPVRIEELTNSKPVVEDYDLIAKEIKVIEAKIKEIEETMDNKSKDLQKQNEAITGKHNELNKLKSDLRDSQTADKSEKNNQLQEIERKINDGKSKLRTVLNAKELAAGTIRTNEKQLEVYEKDIQSKRDELEKENEKEITFDESKFSCPSCKRPLEADNIESMKSSLLANFNKDKIAKVEAIRNKGHFLKEQIEKLQAQNIELKLKEDQNEAAELILNEELDKLNVLKKETLEMPEVVSEKSKELQSKIEAFKIPEIAAIDNNELRNQRAGFMTEIDKFKVKLQSKEQIQKTDTRIKELSEQEKTLSQQLADLEKREFNIDAFNKRKIEMIEKRINSKFNLVKFKMFSTNINGGEEECCECLVNGVPYSDLNTAGRINAGLDVINALCDYYGVSAPIFIDNRESIINTLPTSSQMINLIVTNDEELVIDNGEEAYETTAKSEGGVN